MQMVDCGPILPSRPGQAPNEALLRLFNEGSRPAEVVAVELDPRLLAEEAGLALLDQCVAGTRRCRPWGGQGGDGGREDGCTLMSASARVHGLTAPPPPQSLRVSAPAPFGLPCWPQVQ